MLDLRVISWPHPGTTSAFEGSLEASGRSLSQVSHANQIVSCSREGEHPSHAARSPMPGLPQSGGGLDPAEDLFHPLALPLADRVARMPGGSCINCTTAVRMLILGHVWTHRRFPQFAHKIPCVVILVPAQRYSSRAARNPRRHLQGR